MKIFTVNNRNIGPGYPAYIVAEMSANHNKSFEKAVEIVKAAKKAGADAIKLQTYTPDTITVDCDNEYTRIKGTLWDGRTLYDLYSEAYMPWDWQPKLKAVADEIGIDLISTPFDPSAVDFLEKMNLPAYKVASSEIVDLPLLQKIASTWKPLIMSTGMATLEEIRDAVKTVREAGCDQLVLLKCTSAYPAPVEEMNLRTIPHLAAEFGVFAGLSDHTLGTEVSVAAVALGACIIEKHFTLSRDDTGPDSAFSLEPNEFKAMVDSIRIVEKALGRVAFGASDKEKVSRSYRRSLFVVSDMKAGDEFNASNVKSIRPGHGLHPGMLSKVLGRRAKRDIQKGTPLNQDMIK